MQNSWIIRAVVSSIFLIVNPAWALFDQCRDYFPEERIPITQEKGRDLCFDGFAVFYSPTTKKPIYTVERLNRARLTAQHQQRTNQFYEEARLPFADRALLSDYKNSGYDRGHNAPAGDMTTAGNWTGAPGADVYRCVGYYFATTTVNGTSLEIVRFDPSTDYIV